MPGGTGQAVRENLIRSNPAVGCKLPPKRGREMQVLSRQELQRFLIQAKADDYFELFLLTYPRDYAGVSFWLSSGPTWIWILERVRDQTDL